MRVFLKVLQEGDSQFIAEQNSQVTAEQDSRVFVNWHWSGKGTLSCFWNRMLQIARKFQFCHLLQQLRKLILEIIHRIPTNEHLKQYVKSILSLMFTMIQVRHDVLKSN